MYFDFSRLLFGYFKSVNRANRNHLNACANGFMLQNVRPDPNHVHVCITDEAALAGTTARFRATPGPKIGVFYEAASSTGGVCLSGKEHCQKTHGGDDRFHAQALSGNPRIGNGAAPALERYPSAPAKAAAARRFIFRNHTHSTAPTKPVQAMVMK